MTNAVIIGAGIAGPVAALALHHVGIECSVWEGHPRAADNVGSYLTVASNGVAALGLLDAAQLVIDNGFPTAETILQSGTGKPLARIPLGSTKPGAAGTYTIKRSCLYAALRDEAVRRGIPIEFGKRLVAADELPGGAGVRARFADGTEVTTGLLVGADGAHSATRQIIDPAAPNPRYVGLLNFGGYTLGAPPGAEPGVWYMTFGNRAFFGYVVDRSGNTVWFANVPHPELTREERLSRTVDEWRGRLLELFAEDESPAQELIWSGALELAGNNTYDLPTVPTWRRDRMLIMGDAAHAPSPSSGQGASLAIEDAVVLAKCLRDVQDVRGALAAYERGRRARVERVVRHGARMSNNKTPGPMARVLRDITLPLMLKLVARGSSLAWLHDYRIDWTSRMSDGRRAA